MNETYSLKDLLAERLLEVPDYQRGYAWERDHRDDFLQDLELLSEGHEHYTGTVVLHKIEGGGRTRDEKGNSYPRYEIVDGQQRITTAVILLDALQRHFGEIGKARLADEIRSSYVAVTDSTGSRCIGYA